jgi:signal transduction histidine kinase
VTSSLRWSLAARFAATMAAGLAAASAVLYYYHTSLFETTPQQLLLALVVVVVLGSGATFFGAWWLAWSAVRPVAEITAQATEIEPGTLNHRIVAHADTEEYRDLVAVLNGMLERLDAAFQSQRRLTADVGHELRTPLTALRGQIEVALRGERTPRDYELVLRSALEGIETLTTMSEDLLMITRAESHLLTLDRAPTDPNAIVSDALEHPHTLIEEKGLEVEQSLDPRVHSVPLDPALVTRLVEHLLDNAVKFTPVGGRIGVQTEAVTPGMTGVRVAVENSGPGIAALDLPHVFEPFYRADQARSSGTGTGLGLTLVAAIARLHGGAVRVRNQNGTGVRFEVDLPAPASG